MRRDTINNIIRSEACPECKKNGHDKTGNHLLVFKDGNKFCNRKQHHSDGKFYYVFNKEKPPEKKEFLSYVQVSTFKEIQGYPFKKLEDRKIPEGVCKIYGVRVSYEETTREIDAHYYPRYDTTNTLVGFKQRLLPKQFTIYSNKKAPVILFGQWIESFQNSRDLIITGGEEDALAAYLITGRRMSRPIPAVAPPDGENFNAFEIPEVLKFLRHKEKIYLALDKDEAGKKLEKKLVDLLGFEKVRIVNFSEKDVSDMLVKEKEQEFVDSLFSAKEYKPNGIVSIGDLDDDEVCKPVEWGLSYPFKSLTKITYGARPGEVIGIGAAPGAGKSTFIRQLQKHFVFHHKEKIAVYSLEEGVDLTTKHLIGSIMRKPIHLPDCEYDVEEAKRVKQTLNNHVYLFNCEEYHNWEDIVGSIRYFATIGVKYFFIDPLSALVAHLPPSEANTWLSSNMYKFEKMANTLGVTFFHTNHLNNPQTGKDHGAGGRVYGSQFSGSRAQWKFSTSLWGLERDQMADDGYEKNIVRFSSIKSRMSGNTGSFLMIYKPETGGLEEDSEMIKRIKGE